MLLINNGVRVCECGNNEFENIVNVKIGIPSPPGWELFKFNCTKCKKHYTRYLRKKHNE